MFHCFVFFKFPSHTEIYTYLHTLSLPYALPLLLTMSGSSPRRRMEAGDCVANASLSPTASMSATPRPALASAFSEAGTGPRPMISGARRSDEHTSELQSLLRISYAAFCL